MHFAFAMATSKSIGDIALLRRGGRCFTRPRRSAEFYPTYDYKAQAQQMRATDGK